MRRILAAAVLSLVLNQAARANPPGVQTSAAPCVPVDRSEQTLANGAQLLAGQNLSRSSVSFQVPSTLTGGVWVNWTGTAGNGTSGSFNFPAGTLLVSLDASVVGTGPISIWTATGSILLPAIEC